MKRFEITYTEPNVNIFPVVAVIYASNEKKAIKILINDMGENLIIHDVRVCNEMVPTYI